ncbi:germin-like protein subfamily 1 member 11 [Gossypium australe]|uniref:Germin-like protein n=1 Tax=Gossypium australe TaxID=47621 RepID=A0A5B6VV00_9ROSI|nr:germin-like protein subfamily 1 member 11 [Gossypium australe]
MDGFHFLQALFILALASSLAYASDPSPLQDFCEAINDPNDAVFVNGKLDHLSLLSMLRKSQDLTLGISLARIDYAANGGLNPPHTHPRATEILVVLEGTLYVGFVTSNPDNRLIAKVLNKGDVFVFPVGLVHFQFNPGKSKAVAIAALSSQDPGVITIANAVFGSDPSINPDVLSKAFKLDKSMVKSLQSKF